MLLDEGILLRSLTYTPRPNAPDEFPFNVPIIQSLTRLDFRSPVTFFVGDNGCGKSTLLEGLACAIGSITVGAESVDIDQTLSALRPLAQRFKLAWTKRTRRGFFMRSEDFFGYARKMSAIRADLKQTLEETEKEYENKSPTARLYARAAYANELGAMRRDYGENLDARSHGESYLKLIPGALCAAGAVPAG